MVTATSGASTLNAYPNPSIDPRQKGYDWILQYCRAAYNDSRGYMPNGCLNTGALKMDEIKAYALGKQSVDKYKKLTRPGQPADIEWRAVDWTPPAFLCKYREIAISKILQQRYNITAYAIDPLSKSEEDAYFNQMKVKIMMRQAAEQAGSELSENPMLQPQPGEPEDMEQLQMQMQYGYKHQMALEAENAINLILEQNNKAQIERDIITSCYDYGFGAATCDIDENGMVKTRVIDGMYLGLSYCEKQDFSDLVHWWELVPTYVADLAPFYTKEQLDDICKKAVNKNGNPNQYVPVNGLYNQAWNRFKVFVMKIKFLSWNDTVYKTEVDSKGNDSFVKSDYKNKRFLSVNQEGELTGDDGYFEPLTSSGREGQAYPKYIGNTVKVVYKASWVVDTEYMHDYGIKENQNRKLSSWWNTDLDLYILAWNFHRMQFTGITERLIPFEDRACMLWYNLQNLSNKLIPYLINIDISTIEATNFGKGGKAQKPSEVIDFIFSNYVALYRSTDLTSRNPSYKPVSIEATGELAAFGMLYDQLQATLAMMQQVSGLNELTDSSTPPERTAIPVAEAAVQSTNNAIYLVSNAYKDVMRRLCDGIIQKIQIAVKLGKVEGYAKALGSNTVQFFQINPDIALCELGIFIDDAPTDDQRIALWQDINIKESQGLLTPADKYFIMTCRNLGEAVQILDYKIQKRKEAAQAEALAVQEKQGEMNAYVQQAAEIAKQDTIELQVEADIIRINAEKEWDFQIEEMKKSFDLQGETIQAEGRNIGHEIQGRAKIIAAEIAAKASKEAKKLAAKKTKSKNSK